MLNNRLWTAIMHPYQTKLNNTCHNSFCALVAVNYGCNNTLYHINLLVQGFDSVHMVYQTIHHRFVLNPSYV